MEEGSLILLTSPAAVEEFAEVVHRPAFRELIDQLDAEELGNLLRRAEIFSPTSIAAVCRDSSDDYLLALANTAGADVLVTRDEDLLILRKHGRTDIVHVAEFLRRLGK